MADRNAVSPEARPGYYSIHRKADDLGLKVGRIDLEKQISLAQLLVVSDRNVNNRTRYPRGDANDVCSDLAISGPGLPDVPTIERDSCPTREANNDQRN